MESAVQAVKAARTVPATDFVEGMRGRGDYKHTVAVGRGRGYMLAEQQSLA